MENNICQNFINLVNNTELNRDEIEQEIINIINDTNDIYKISEFIMQLGKHYTEIGLDNEYELNNRYNLQDNNFDYSNDNSFLKLIFDKALFQKINDLDNLDQKIDLINKVFIIANNTNIAGYSVMYLMDNITCEIFNNYQNEVKSVIKNNIAYTLGFTSYVEDDDVLDMSIESLFNNIEKINLNNQEIIDFVAFTLETTCGFHGIDDYTMEIINNKLLEHGIDIDTIVAREVEMFEGFNNNNNQQNNNLFGPINRFGRNGNNNRQI